MILGRRGCRTGKRPLVINANLKISNSSNKILMSRNVWLGNPGGQGEVGGGGPASAQMSDRRVEILSST